MTIIEGRRLPAPPDIVDGVADKESISGQSLHIEGLGTYLIDLLPLGGKAFRGVKQPGSPDKQGPEQIVLKPALLGANAEDRVISDAAFVRQNRIMTDLAKAHANVPRPLGFLSIEEGPQKGMYYMTQYMGIESLEAAMSKLDTHNKLDRLAILYTFRSMVEQLQIAHRNLIINRDVKPSNVQILEDGVGFTDWETAYRIGELLEEHYGSVQSGGYTALEARGTQRLPEPTDDIFALGMSLYAMFKKDDPPDELIANPDNMDKYSALEGTEVDNQPDKLRWFMYSMTAFAIENRPQQLSDVLEALENVIDSGEY